jgi:hypothetical protein
MASSNSQVVSFLPQEKAKIIKLDKKRSVEVRMKKLFIVKIKK